MPLKLKFVLLFLLWLAGAVFLWTSDNKTPIIIITGGILIRSFLVEAKVPGDMRKKTDDLDA